MLLRACHCPRNVRASRTGARLRAGSPRVVFGRGVLFLLLWLLIECFLILQVLVYCVLCAMPDAMDDVLGKADSDFRFQLEEVGVDVSVQKKIIESGFTSLRVFALERVLPNLASSCILRALRHA